MMKRFVLCVIVFSCCSLAQVKAQSKSVSDTSKSATTSIKNDKTLDTNESIKYLGSSLWFQMKKRLNLTSEEEEKQESEKKKRKPVLSIGGIKIES